jgi:hypothetical protein
MSDVPTDARIDAAQYAAPVRYEIRVKGHLADRWAAWFDGMILTPQGDGTTLLRGLVADQSALHGLLRKVSDLGLPLVSVTPTATDEPSSVQTDPIPPTGTRRSTT